MPNPQISTQDWFYHPPSAKPQGPSCIVAPVTSQIPGLNNTPEDSATKEQDQHCFRRKWIRDTDSKYVKLAKAGGRKHLLTFNNNSKLSSEPVLYPRVDWFDHNVHNDEGDEQLQRDEQTITTNCDVLPEWYVHNVHAEKRLENNEVIKEENGKAANISGKRPILGFDSMSAWQRENQLLSTKKSSKSKSVQLPKIKQPSDTSKMKLTKKSVKLPKIKSDKHSSDMDQDMMKLLSMDYQREWLLNKSLEDSKEIKAKQTIQKEKQERQKRIIDHSLRPRKAIVEEKPLFKLSRFNKVKSCVDSRWSELESQSLDKSVPN